MAKIITVTANTAIDLFVEVDGLGLQDNLLAKRSAEFACGKGVNVAKAIATLGMPVVCLGFVGQQSLPLFEALNGGLLRVDFTAVAGKTRTNITLCDATAGLETHIRTPGFTVTAEDCQRLLEKLAATVAPGDKVVFSGSLPAGAPDGFYGDLVGLCRRHAATAFLDSSGAALAEGIKAQPYLIKPNQQELEGICAARLADLDAVVAAARGIVARGVPWVCVSRGAQGAVLVGERLALAVQVGQLPGKPCSQVGCGDAMLAGWVFAALHGMGIEDSAKLATACATANLYAIEPGCFDRGLLPGLLQQVRLTPL